MFKGELYCDVFTQACMQKNGDLVNSATKVKLNRAKRENGKPTRPRQRDFSSTSRGSYKGATK